MSVIEFLNRARFALPQSETSERSEVRCLIASRFESLNSCWVERLLYDRRPTQQELNYSRRDAIGRITSNLSQVSQWGRVYLVLFNVSKLNFYNYQIDIIFQITIPSSSMTLNFPSPPP